MGLGDFFIKFGSDGEEKLKANLKELKRAMEDMADAGEKVPNSMKKAFRDSSRAVEDHKSSMGAMIGGAVGGFAGAAAGKVADFAMGGLTNSAEFEHFTTVLDKMGRIVGGALLPALEGVESIFEMLTPSITKIADTVGRLVAKESDLFVGAIAIYEPLIDIFVELGTACADLAITLQSVIQDGVLGLAVMLHDTLLPALKQLADFVQEFAGLVPHYRHGGHELSPRGGGFEDVSAIYKRIQMAALKSGGPQHQTAESHLAEIRKHFEEMMTPEYWVRMFGGLLKPMLRAMEQLVDFFSS